MVVLSAAESFPWAEATIPELQHAMAEGKVSSAQLTDAYLARIAAINRGGPKLNAVIEINPDARQIAAELDAERKAGHERGPLHGIPILIKDNIATVDRMETTAGSLALVGAKPAREAAIVTRLRAAGAVILGKTNLSEWANFRSSPSTSGWSGRGGQTRNPYDPARSPAGSSSGSAVAVSANLCVVAVGTETDGSIVSPSSICGIVGVKPTVGLVSRSGIIPISSSQDTAGPMARTVRDAAILLGVLTGADEADAATSQSPAGGTVDYAAALTPGALKGARVGIMRGPFGMKPKVAALLPAVIARLRAAGAEVIDPLSIPTAGQAGGPEMEVLLYEFKQGLNDYLATLGPGAPVKSLADLIAFNEKHAAEEMPFFEQSLLHLAQAKGPLTDPAYLAARAECVRLARTDGIDRVMAGQKLDAIVALTAGPAWMIDLVNGDAYTGGSSTLAAVAGYPSVTVPTAELGGMPVGVSFFGAAWSEAKLLALAADFEAQGPARRVPPLP
jgi:amidase